MYREERPGVAYLGGGHDRDAERSGDSRPRGDEALRERACPLEKMAPTGGPVITATQGAEMNQGDVAQSCTF